MAIFSEAPILIEAFKTYVAHGISPGKLILILIAAPALFASGYVWLFKYKFPFSMMLYSPPRTDKKIICTFPKGQHSIGVRLRTREVTELRVMDIRFVNYHWFRATKDAPTNKIEIIDMKNISWGDGSGPEGMRAEPNMVGGYTIQLKPFKLWAAGDFIYLEFVFEAHSPWSGHLGFEGRAGHRARVHHPIKILEDSYAPSTWR